MIRLRRAARFLFPIPLVFAALQACRHQSTELEVADGGYPADVNRIIILNCTSGITGGGCHNAVGSENSGGLRLDEWDKLFDGTRHGAAVIPFDTANSPLLHYINIDSAIGSRATPVMPLGRTPLSREDYLTLRAWIARGAPDKNGRIAFSENPSTRQKVYLTSQATDLVHVIDASRHVVMRNILVGTTGSIESPHCVRISNDGAYAYVSFLAGDYIQKIDTRTDQVVAQAKVSNGDAQWNILHLSEDGTMLMASDFTNGWLRVINTATMQVAPRGTIGNPGSPLTPFRKPHGIASTPAFDTIYMTGQHGNTIFKFAKDDLSSVKYISIDGSPSQFSAGTRDPHEIMLTPDGSRYFVTCESSHEIRVMDARADTLIAIIPTGRKPQEIAISKTKPYMLFTVMEADNPTPGTKGVVMVVNYQTLQVVKTINGPFWQPHGITVDDAAGTFYVASTNIGGPFNGHNHTKGTGPAGWYSVYSLSTLELLKDRQYEVLSQPYSADTRFK